VWINVVPPDGIPRRVAGYHDESLLEVIKRSHVPDIYGKTINLFYIILIYIDDCQGGDAEMKPH
jgi:hypothetical protein